ncbi:MAG: ABC transporter permease subunit, partial [Pedosphaera parvula]|nr:ABC transporter permease subunit [Pedosphaera parvula]
MNVLPVIVRELRAEARHGLNYRLRVFAMVPVLFVSGVIILESGADARTLGMMLFTGAHITLLTLICLVGPTLTADCISREKREGTLGLLFLTPLKPSEIVVGKSFVHLLRAFTLWLAALPVLTIPFILGGLTWAGVLKAISFQFAFGLLTLGAGLLASAFTGKSVRAVVAAELLALALLSLLVAGLALGYFVQVISLPPLLTNEFSGAYERALALA